LPPPPIDPAAGFPYPSFPDFPARAQRRNPAAQAQQACSFVEPAEFDTALRFNAHADRIENSGAPASFGLAAAASYSVKTFFYVPPGGALPAFRILWCLENAATFNHLLYLNGSNQLSWFDNNVNGQVIGNIERGVWYYAIVNVGPDTAGVGPVTIYWGRVGTSPTTYNITGSPNVGFAPDRFTVGSWNQGVNEFMTDGRITGVQLWSREIDLTRAAFEAAQLGPYSFTNIVIDWRLQRTASVIDAVSTTKLSGSNPGGAGAWEEQRGPFVVYGPERGHPWPQPVDPVRPARPRLEGGAAFVFNPAAAPAFDPSTGFPWLPPSEPVRRAARASEGFNALALVQAAAPAVDLRWEPTFPDALRRAPAPLNVGGEFSAVLEREPQLDWLPSFADFARSRKPLPTLGGEFRTVLEYEPTLDWLPSFADFARGRRPLPLLGGEFSAVLEREPQLDWLPTYADFARGPKRPVNEGVLAWAVLEYEPTLDWEPSFPDFARGPARALNVGQSVRPVDAPAAPIFTAFDWQPEFPDFAHAAKRPVNEGGLAWAVLEREPQLDWLPSFADFARSRRPLPLLGGEFSTVLEYEPTLDWAPIFPDFARARKPLPILGGEFGTVLEREPQLDWLSSFPDFARGQRPLVQTGLSVFPVQEREPQLDWSPAFPDFARAPARALNAGQSVQPVSPPAAAVVALDWLPSFADFARVQRRPVNDGGLTRTVLEREPQLDWLPSFADFARSRRPLPLLGGEFRTVLEREPQLDWLPTYADFARAKRCPVNEGGLAWAVLEREPQLDWLPTYPSILRPSVRIPLPSEVVAPFQRALLVSDWSPLFPDFARGRQPLPILGGVGPLVVSDAKPAPLLSWAPSFPDFARALRFPLNTGGLNLALFDRGGPLYAFKLCGTLVEGTPLVGVIRTASIEGVLPVTYLTGHMLDSALEGNVGSTYITVVLDEGHTC
jgi:hypothetical protein